MVEFHQKNDTKAYHIHLQYRIRNLHYKCATALILQSNNRFLSEQRETKETIWLTRDTCKIRRFSFNDKRSTLKSFI